MTLFFGALLNFLFNDFISHIPIHFIRIGFLRFFNKSIHSSVKVLMHVRIQNFWNLEAGPRVVINQFTHLDCRRYRISIAADTDIGPYCKIWTLEHIPNDNNHTISGGDVIIGDHVWIASGVTILPGVNISRGAVLAAGSLVNKDVNEKEIIGGVPGKVIGVRDNPLTYSLTYEPLFD